MIIPHAWGWSDNPSTASAWTGADGSFDDKYEVCCLEVICHPSTTWPGEPNWDTAVRHAGQYYRAGTLTSGVGKLFKQHILQLYRGCARQY